MRRVFLVLSMAACGVAPAALPGGASSALVSRCECWPVPAPGPARALVADTAAAWREVRSQLGEAGLTLPADWCTFAIERAIVLVVPGAVGGPVAVAEHSEEGVDVLVLTPRPEPAASGLAIALVVPAQPNQLAVVWRWPEGAGGPGETTLAVFAGR